MVLQLEMEEMEQQLLFQVHQQLTLVVEVVEDTEVPHLVLPLLIPVQLALEVVEEEDMVVQVKPVLVELQEQLILVVEEVDPLIVMKMVVLVDQV